jgi:2-keto-3-deoxy-L-rhamnonate aldolase RhmA
LPSFDFYSMIQEVQVTSSPSATLVNPLAEQLRSGGLGLALMIRHARTVDIALAAKTCGFDALYFDLQHTSTPEDAVAQMSVAAMSAGVTPLVRVPDRDYGTALRMLDSGAMGIVMPDVSTAEDARQAVEHCKFAPIGKRGAYGSWPHFGYRALPATAARKALNDNTLLIVMIESAAALDNVEAIAAVAGVDIVHVGSNDLATDLGVPGELVHPKVLAGIERLVGACRKHGKVPGVGGLTGGDVGRIEQVVKLGARFLTAATEWNLMMAAGQERVRVLRALAPG